MQVQRESKSSESWHRKRLVRLKNLHNVKGRNPQRHRLPSNSPSERSMLLGKPRRVIWIRRLSRGRLRLNRLGRLPVSWHPKASHPRSNQSKRLNWQIARKSLLTNFVRSRKTSRHNKGLGNKVRSNWRMPQKLCQNAWNRPPKIWKPRP